MQQKRSVLLVSASRPADAALQDAVRRLHASGARALLVTYRGALETDGDPCADEAHALTPAAQGHGPAFRRALRHADPPTRLWLHVAGDAWVTAHAPHVAAVVPLDRTAELSARRLAKRYDGVRQARDIDTAVRRLWHSGDQRPTARRARRAGGPGDLADQLPAAAVRVVLAAPGLSEHRRYRLARRTALRLLRAGRAAAADQVATTALRRLRTPRVRADLLGDVVSAELAEGHAPMLAREAYAAELLVADRHHASGRHRRAAASFDEATRTAFHRVLHFDRPTSPLAADPLGFTAPLRNSVTAAAVRAPRGRTRVSTDARSPGDRTRLLIATRRNADFLREIRTHFGDHPEFDTGFVDFADNRELNPLVGQIAEQTLTGGTSLPAVAETVFRPHLDRADVVLVDWCTALSALLTQVDPGDTRVVVRMHSYEAFSHWPHLVDFSRIDDLVLVSDHLRDLAVAAVPALQGPNAPRLHVVANAMDLRRCDRPKPDAARFTLALVGASKPVKDPRWAIEVLRRLRAHDDRYRLLLIGGRFQRDASAATRAYGEAYQRDLDELEPSGAVRRLRFTDDVPAALQDVGVVLSASVRESFHIGLAEGAASGAVPVVRDWPFFPGAVGDLFPADWVVKTPRDAARRVVELTSSDEVWRRNGRAASEHAVARWDWSHVRHDYERLLRR